MLCGRMVKRKLNERDDRRVPLSDDSQWQDHLMLKRSRMMEESAMRDCHKMMEKSATRDCHGGCTQPEDSSRWSRGEANLKLTGMILLISYLTSHDIPPPYFPSKTAIVSCWIIWQVRSAVLFFKTFTDYKHFVEP